MYEKSPWAWMTKKEKLSISPLKRYFVNAILVVLLFLILFIRFPFYFLHYLFKGKITQFDDIAFFVYIPMFFTFNRIMMATIFILMISPRHFFTFFSNYCITIVK